MTTELDDWRQILSRVSGKLVGGEQRVTTSELLTVHLGIPVTDQACRRLRRVMHELGWRGPRTMRFGARCQSGYWRYPVVGTPQPRNDSARLAPARVDDGLAVERSSDGELARELEGATQLGLKKIVQILQLPTDRHDGNVLRAQVTAASIAINAQLRADEARLRTKSEGDVLDRLLKAIEAEKRRQAEQAERREAGKNDVDLVHIDNKPSEREG